MCCARLASHRTVAKQELTLCTPERTVIVQPHQWPSLPGITIEVWVHGRLLLQGVVEDVMPDKSGLWLAAHGWDGRKFIDIGPVDEIRAWIPEL